MHASTYEKKDDLVSFSTMNVNVDAKGAGAMGNRLCIGKSHND